MEQEVPCCFFVLSSFFNCLCQTSDVKTPSHPHQVLSMKDLTDQEGPTDQYGHKTKPGSNNLTKPFPSWGPPFSLPHCHSLIGCHCHDPQPCQHLPLTQLCASKLPQISLLWTGLMPISTHHTEIQTCWLCKSSSLRAKIKASSPQQTPLGGTCMVWHFSVGSLHMLHTLSQSPEVPERTSQHSTSTSSEMLGSRAVPGDATTLQSVHWHMDRLWLSQNIGQDWKLKQKVLRERATLHGLNLQDHMSPWP